MIDCIKCSVNHIGCRLLFPVLHFYRQHQDISIYQGMYFYIDIYLKKRGSFLGCCQRVRRRSLGERGRERERKRERERERDSETFRADASGCEQRERDAHIGLPNPRMRRWLLT